MDERDAGGVVDSAVSDATRRRLRAFVLEIVMRSAAVALGRRSRRLRLEGLPRVQQRALSRWADDAVPVFESELRRDPERVSRARWFELSAQLIRRVLEGVLYGGDSPRPA